jgi:RND family efflux transporter MFP subunit
MKQSSVCLTPLVAGCAVSLVLALLAGFTIYRVRVAPVQVISHRVLTGPIVAEVGGTGTLETHFRASASPKLAQGRLVQVLVDQNDFVTNGQLLAVLDDREQRCQVEAAQATLSAALATVRRVQADEARAQAGLKLAELKYQRQSELLSAKINSRQEFDTAVADLQTAQSALGVAQSAIAEMEQQRLAAEKQLGYQKELLADTLIRAPFNGLVVKRNHDRGDVVTPGTSILDLVDTNEIWVSAWVDETALARLRTNQPARVVFRSEPARACAGRVVRLGRKTDPETRELVVDVRLRELPTNWTIGQRAEVYIEAGQATNVVVLPAKFLCWRDGQPGVLVNEQGWARWRDVKFRLRGGDAVEVTSGLRAGEQVVAPVAGEATRALAGRRVQPQCELGLLSQSGMP